MAFVDGCLQPINLTSHHLVGILLCLYYQLRRQNLDGSEYNHMIMSRHNAVDYCHPKEKK